jgi:hypothetical protein
VKGFKQRVCDVALIGAYAIDTSGRAFVYHHNDCAVQCAAIDSVVEGGQLIVACDISKLGDTGRWSVFDLRVLAKDKRRKIVLVTNKPECLSSSIERKRAEETISNLKPLIEVFFTRTLVDSYDEESNQELESFD